MKSKKPILFILILCFILRLSFFLAVQYRNTDYQQQFIKGDALEYHILASNLVNYHQFSSEKDGPPNSYRTPGYPLFISIFYLIFGPQPWIVLFVQIIVDTITCLFVYLIGGSMLSKRAGLFSSFFYALDPSAILHTSTLLSDILFVFFILLSIYFFSKLIKGKNEKEYVIPLILSSIFIAIATLIRPITIYLPILLILFLLIYFKGKIKYAFKLALIFFVIFILTLSPWMIRNAIIFGSYSLSSSSAKSLIEMYVPPFEMEKRNQPYETVTSSLMNEADSLMLKDGLNPYKMDEFQKSPYWKKVALKHIGENPILFLKHYAIGTIHYFINLGTRGYTDMLNLEVKTKDFDIKGKPNPLESIKLWFAKKSLTEILIGIFISLFLLVSYSGLLAGLIMGWKKYNKAYLVLCLLMVFYFVLTTGPQGLERYRLPSIPFYLTFTSLGIIYMIDRFKSKFIPKN